MRNLNTSKHLWSFEHTFKVSAEILAETLCDTVEGTFTTSTAPLLLRTYTEYPEIVIKKDPERNKFNVYEKGKENVLLFNIVCDKDAQVLIIYGGWWYYGKYSIEEKKLEDSGKPESVLRLDAYNAARKYTRWMTASATRTQEENDSKRFKLLVEEISKIIE
jgi:hypothetical protein